MSNKKRPVPKLKDLKPRLLLILLSSPNFGLSFVFLIFKIKFGSNTISMG